MRTLLSATIILSLIATPAVSFADAGDVCHQAQRDARRDVNETLWFTLGCLLGIFGVGAAYLITPSPSATRLMGKSSEYVNVYIECYKDKGRSIQVKKAFNGCLIWSVVVLLTGGSIAVTGCLF